MKYIFILAVVFTAITGCNHSAMPSSTPVVNTQLKTERGDTILTGHCALSIIQTNPYKQWFDKSYSSYTPDAYTVNLIKPMLAGKTIEVFLGSWCGDSKREVPRLVKVLQTAGFDTANLKLVFVDNATSRYKQSPQHEEAGKLIHHVPTIIVYNHDKEMGRIIETPVITLEKDLLAILVHRAYAPHYKDVAWWAKHVKATAPLSDDKLKSLAAQVKPMCENMRDFNAYGYVLLAQHNYTEAINVFKLNTLLFPANAGTYDSLGEACLLTGNKQQARKYYEKVLELKPGDENAKKVLAGLN